MSTNSLNILVSIPNASQSGVFLPIIWGILKSSADKDLLVRESFHWLDPIFLLDHEDKLLEPYQDKRIDVLALSCYQWNWRLQCLIAKKVKQTNPNCVVIAGGPQVDYTSRSFFDDFPFIDYITSLEAELVVAPFLRAVIHNTLDTDIISGVHSRRHPYPDKPPKILANLSDSYTSPWVEELDYWHKLIGRFGPGFFNVAYHSNRGCPYACSFCDWGSLTQTRVRAFDTKLVDQELEIIFDVIKPSFLFLADANFGILKRDIDIATKIRDLKKIYGFPNYLYYSPSKNHVQRNIDISNIFLKANIISNYTLSIQHTDENVLDIMGRTNIKTEKYRDLIDKLVGSGTPIYVQLIIGCPGDTLEKWKKTLTDLMEWGCHSEYRIYLYNLLPNAPASRPDYLKHWQIKTIQRYNDLPYSTGINKNLKRIYSKSSYIVESASFSQLEYVEMLIFSHVIQSLHNFGITRVISHYLKTFQNISYYDFYNHIYMNINDLPSLAGTIADLRAHLHEWLVNEEAFFQINFRDIKMVDPEEYLTLSLIFMLNDFYAELNHHLQKHYDHVGDIVSFQKDLIITPAYRFNPSERVSYSLPWPEIYKNGFSMALYEQAHANSSQANKYSYTIYPPDPLSEWKVDWSEPLTNNIDINLFINSVIGTHMSRTNKLFHRNFVRA
jgi:putative methyltransferase